MRIKIPTIKGNPSRSHEIERQLEVLEGVKEVSANPTTGSVVVLYDSRRLFQDDIVSALTDLGYLPEANWAGQGDSNPAAGGTGVVEKVTATLAASIMEVALTRLVSALI